MDFPKVEDDGKDELTLHGAVAEEDLEGRDEFIPRGSEHSPDSPTLVPSRERF